MAQPSAAYRNFKVFFTILTLGFGVASVIYAFLPGFMTGQFVFMDGLFGGTPGTYPETQNRIWTSLAAANVATLSLMSYLVLKDLKANRIVVLPLLFMKSVSATLFVVWWLPSLQSHSLGLAALGDFATGFGIWYFPRAALAEMGTASAPATAAA